MKISVCKNRTDKAKRIDRAAMQKNLCRSTKDKYNKERSNLKKVDKSSNLWYSNCILPINKLIETNLRYVLFNSTINIYKSTTLSCKLKKRI